MLIEKKAERMGGGRQHDRIYAEEKGILPVPAGRHHRQVHLSREPRLRRRSARLKLSLLLADLSWRSEKPAKRGKKRQIYPQKLSATYEKTQKWLRNIQIELVSDVNAYIEEGRGNELIGIAEALQEKEISDIADRIANHCRSVRAVLISGPSSLRKNILCTTGF